MGPNFLLVEVRLVSCCQGNVRDSQNNASFPFPFTARLSTSVPEFFYSLLFSFWEKF